MLSIRSHADSAPCGSVECYSALLESIPSWDWPRQESPACPACCWQPTLQVWWAATGGQLGACGRRTQATLGSGVAGTCASQLEMHGGQVHEALLVLFLQLQQEFVDGLLHLLLVRYAS